MNDKPRFSILTKVIGGALAVVLAAAGWLRWTTTERSAVEASSESRLLSALPQPRQDGEFITSQGCRECHAEQYTSWHASYHRTMTQPATLESVHADFDNVTLELHGCEYRLSREGDTFWVELPEMLDPRSAPAPVRSDTVASDSSASDTTASRTKRQIVMATGSHHFQLFWMATGAGNLLKSIPFVYLLGDRRWVSVNDVVLEPPSVSGQPMNTWNNGCSRCHSVGPLPRVNPEITRAETQVAELGIACEACHGPGGAHAQRHRGVAVADRRSSDQPDPTIMLPSRCDHRVSAQICGQCHSLFTYKDTRNHDLMFGYQYRAGGELTDDRYIVRPMERVSEPRAREVVAEFFHDTGGEEFEFWADYTPRITGREYNGLLESACYQRGKLSCVSCHSMHESDPSDQLAAKMEGNQACYQCHAEYRERLVEHTHHGAESTGSMCYNCHMPNTTYGVMAFSRSHRIDSPSVAREGSDFFSESGFKRPNACVLCHLDQTLPWAGKHLASWYGQPEPPMEDEAQSTVAASVLYALRGDACQRALIAWHARWEPARAVSGSGWLTPVITQLLTDPYSAVRYQAGKTLKTLPGFEKLPYDYVAPSEVQAMHQEQAVQLWNQRSAIWADRRGAELLLEPADGKPMLERMRALLDQRDNRPMRCVN